MRLHPSSTLAPRLGLVLSLLGSACLLLSSPSYAAREVDNIEAAYNPKPLEGDVIVDMPCGLSMVFRKVYTSNEGKLADKGFSAGSANSESLMTQAPNHRYIQGSFHDKNGYYYLIAKYELSSLQYQVLKDYQSGKGKCPASSQKATVKDRIAKSNISWFEAIDLTCEYSHFLASQASTNTPSNEQKVPAFARLPTDSEWEFAVRGGLKVSSSQFNADVYPFAEGKQLSDYEWYNGQGSASDGKVRAIGLKEPNPLGLFDMLGNVSEMMLDPFYATRTGRLHGQSGGFIVRGGSVKSSESTMVSSSRSERAYFARGQESKTSDCGLRMVLSLPFTSSIQEVKELNEAIAKLGVDDDAQDVKGGGNLNTIGELDKILAEQKAAQEQYKYDTDALNSSISNLKRSLTSLRERMIEANTKKDEMRDRAIVSNLRLGGYLCSALASQQIIYERTLKSEEIVRKLPISSCLEDENSQKCREAKQAQEAKLKANRENAANMIDLYVSYYADHVNDTFETFDLKFVSVQVPESKRSASKSFSSLPEYIDQFMQDLKQYASGETRDLTKNKTNWVQQCRALKH